MNNPLAPLMALLAQTERERDDALAQHQRLEAALQAAQAQADQLLTYRRDYEQRWTTQFSKEGSMPLFNCYQNFNERLTQAVDFQRNAVQQAQYQADRGRALWMEQEIRVASVRKLIERRVHELQLSAERREQKTSDEFASRLSWSNTRGPGAAATS
ncbi:MAG: flagellar export protein FliJ [Burkholderiales bacterium]